MVSQATVQAKVNYGFAKAAAALGETCQWYRPSGANNPITAANLIGTWEILFDTAADMQQRAPRRREKPEDWYGGFDMSQFQIGDYLIRPNGEIRFISAFDSFRACRMVLCNHTISLARPAGPSPGTAYYGSDVTATETSLMTGWPAAVVQGTKGEAGETKLPGDTRLPWVTILVPDCGVELRTGDQALDDQTIPALYTLSGTERTAQGWRITAMLATP